MKVFFDITNRCNASCLYCFTNSNKEGYENELCLDEIISLIDNLVKNDISKLSIAGGEPFLREIDKIMRYCNGKIDLSLTTNGTILNDKIVKSLKETKTKLTISIDSLNQDIVDKVRKGIDIEKLINNIKKLCDISEIRDRLSLRTTVSTLNIDHVEELIEFSNKLKIKKLKINSTNPFGRALNNLDLIPNFWEFESKYKKLEDYIKCNSDVTKVEIPVMKYLTKKDKQCLLGKNSIYINSKGDVFPCAFSNNRLAVGNIKNDPINELIQKCNHFDKNNDICKNCEIHRYEK